MPMCELGLPHLLATRQTTEMAAHCSMKAFNPQAKDWTGLYLHEAAATLPRGEQC